MFNCKSCKVEFRDGAQCTLCQGQYDFPCAGISETGFRNRRNTWKCISCKQLGAANPLNIPSVKTNPTRSPSPVSLESIALDIKSLSSQISSLPNLIASVKAIQADVADLKTMKADIAELKLIKPEVADMKSSIEFVQLSVETLTGRISEVSLEVQELHKTKEQVNILQQRFEQFEGSMREYEQRSRMNNIEIKGIPLSPSENLFDIVAKVGNLTGCIIPKEQISYVARIPMRNDKINKTIIISVLNRYLKEDFVAAAKKRKIVPADLGLRGDLRIYVNDHLTLENKMLLNKAKNVAKERGFSFIWVRGCKIFARKNPTSHVVTIKSELDLKKLA